jgi:aryl-alcohol dehydrogenase-like predicted oxidoreductase
VDALRTYVEKRGGCSMSQFALAWVNAMPGITSPIIGPRTMAQFDDNMLAFDLKLSAEDFAAVDAIVPKGGMISPFYEADFGPHAHRI